MKYKSTLLYILFVYSVSVCAQITISDNKTAAQLVNKLVGNNSTVLVSNPTLSCPGIANATFLATSNTLLGIDSGIVLTTGRTKSVMNLPGIDNIYPNTAIFNFANEANNALTSTPDPEIATIVSGNLFDLCKLEFDIVPFGDTIIFRYSFASEEYPSSNCSYINDAFGLFISGPGIVGSKNIALVPNTSIPISINSINNGVPCSACNISTCNSIGPGSPFTSFFVDNSNGMYCNYDGYTKVMKAMSYVNPGSTYHLKFAIADAFDALYDSGIFLEAGSLKSSPVASYPYSSGDTSTSTNYAIEGCLPAKIVFKRKNLTPFPFVFNFAYSGNAISGIDYAAMPSSLSIPSLDSIVTLPIQAFSDAIIENNDSLVITATNSLTGYNEVFVYKIYDNTISIFNKKNDTSICNNSPVILNSIVTNPIAKVLWTPNTYLNNQNLTSPTSTPSLSSGISNITYNVNISSKGCLPIDSQVKINVAQNPTVNLGNDTTICLRDSLKLRSSVVTSDSFGLTWNSIIYLSNKDSINCKFFPDSTFNLSVVLTTKYGCVASDNIIVSVSNIKKELTNINKVNPTCKMANGSIEFFVNNAFAPYLYSINNGLFSASKIFTGLGGVSNTYTIKNNYGCKQDTILKLIADTIKLTQGTIVNASCQLNNGSVSSLLNGGVAPLSYNWSNGATSSSISNIPAGSYKLVLTDANNCKDSFISTVNSSPAMLFSLTKTDILCNSTIGQISSSVLSGTPPYSYSWSSGQTTSSITNVSSGWYKLTITDSKGCIKSDSVFVNAFTKPDLTLTKVDNKCNQNDGSIFSNVLNGSGAKTYLWNTGATSANLNGLTQNTYTLIVTDSAGCKDTASIGIIDFPSPIVSTNTKVDAKCGLSNGSIATTLSLGKSPISYSWSNAATTSNISGLAANTYTLIVTDANNCKDTLVETIVNKSLPILSFTSVKQSCGVPNGSITCNVSGAIGSISYLWSNGGTSKTINNLVSGKYFVTITDSLLCNRSDSFTLSAFVVPNLSLSAIHNTCNLVNGSAVSSIVGGTSPISYLWNNNQTTPNINNLSQGTYKLIISDSLNCKDSALVIIIDYPSPVLTSTKVDAKCGLANGIITSTVSLGMAPFVYTWNSGQTTSSISNLLPNTYRLIVKDANNCRDTITENIVNYSLPQLTVNYKKQTCDSLNAWMQVIPSGGYKPYNYTWSNGVSGDSSIYGLSQGTYSVTVTDSLNCTVSSSKLIEAIPTLKTAKSSMPNVCGLKNSNAKVIVTQGTLPYTYLWTEGSINGPIIASTNLIKNIAKNTYYCTTKDLNNCKVIDTFNIDSFSKPKITLSVVNSSCNRSNGQITTAVANSFNPIKYIWSNGSTSKDLNAIASGTYNLIIIDSFLCRDTALATVQQDQDSISFNLSKQDLTCYKNNSGVITVGHISGGVAPYLYKTDYTSFSPINVFSGQSSGLFTVTVEDCRGCLKSDTIRLKEPEELKINLLKIQNIACFGKPTGSIEIAAYGGTPNYQYRWVNLGLNSPIVNNLDSRHHIVIVSDSNRCVKLDSFYIDQPKKLNVTPTIKHLSCFNLDDGSIKLKLSGGTIPYSYIWNNNDTSLSLNGLSPSVYKISITDKNHCIDTFSYQIKNTDSFKFDSIVTFSPSCLDYYDGSAKVYVSGGNGPPFQYKTDADTKYVEYKRLISLTNKQYTLSVLDKDKCIYTTTFNISKPEEIKIELNPRDTIFIDLGASVDIKYILTKGSEASINRHFWAPFNGLNCYDCKSVVASPFISNIYSLTVFYNQEKCYTKDSVWIKIRNSAELFVPNAFAPFSDNKENQTFKIYSNLLKYSNMIIFDRWGEKVFEGENVHNEGWDGTYRGVLLPSGMYSYIVNVEYLDNKKIQKRGEFYMIH